MKYADTIEVITPPQPEVIAWKPRAMAFPKGRTAKLNEAQVREIKRLLKESNMNYTQISNLFGVGASTIQNIACGRNWGWVKADG